MIGIRFKKTICFGILMVLQAPALAEVEPGALLWEYDHEARVNSVFERNGVVYLASGGIGSGWAVAAVDATDGEFTWAHTHHLGAVKSVMEKNGTVFSGSYNGTVIAAKANDGAFQWDHAHHPTDGLHAVFVHDGVVYSGGIDNLVIAADANGGDFIWEHEAEGNVFSIFARDDAIYYGSITTGSRTGVNVLNASDGTPLWSHDHHNARVNSVFERNGVVYSGSNNSKVIAADADDGSFLWEHTHHTSYVYSVFQRDGVVYSGSSNGIVIAADAEDGSFLWQHDHHALAVNSVFERNGVIYSGSDEGVVIAAASGSGPPVPDRIFQSRFTGKD